MDFRSVDCVGRAINHSFSVAQNGMGDGRFESLSRRFCLGGFKNSFVSDNLSVIITIVIIT